MAKELIECSNPDCDRFFKPRNYRHKYCCLECRKEANKPRYLGDGITVRGNKVQVKGALNVLKFFAGGF